MLLFIKALLIFLLIKQHCTTHSSNLREHTWTNTANEERKREKRRDKKRRGEEKERRGDERREEERRVRVKSESAFYQSGSLGGGTEPLGGSVALHAGAWHGARVQWTYKCKGGEERSETCVGVLSEILLPNDVEAARGRLMTAVRDVSDKISPEERVGLQR